LDFLSEGSYSAQVYTDAPDVSENPDHLVKKTIAVTQNDSLTIELAAGGAGYEDNDTMILFKERPFTERDFEN